MCVALIGGMDRLERHYVKEASQLSIDLRVFNRSEVHLGEKLKTVDAVVIFTNKVSHRLRREAMQAARRNGIPVHMEHSCGVCTLRECFNAMNCRLV